MKNKDTAKALEAVETLIAYCNRYENCRKCVFYVPRSLGGCKLNWVNTWEVTK